MQPLRDLQNLDMICRSLKPPQVILSLSLDYMSMQYATQPNKLHRSLSCGLSNLEKKIIC